VARLAMIKCAFLELTFSVGERAVRAGVRAELLPRDVRVARRKPIRRVTCLKTRSSPNPVFLNTTLPRTTADARHATGQAGAHPLPRCTNPASCIIYGTGK
jgi:hypothetical protein